MCRCREALDAYAGMMPPAMAAYLQHYGRHFSRKMYEFAVGQMRTRDGGRVAAVGREGFASFMESNGVSLERDTLYDGAYVLAMGRADFFGSSLKDDRALALWVKDYVDDADAKDGQPFNRFYSDCVLKGVPIDWEAMM